MGVPVHRGGIECDGNDVRDVDVNVNPTPTNQRQISGDV